MLLIGEYQRADKRMRLVLSRKWRTIEAHVMRTTPTATNSPRVRLREHTRGASEAP